MKRRESHEKVFCGNVGGIAEGSLGGWKIYGAGYFQVFGVPACGGWRDF